MESKIDKIDKKILYELEANSRQPLSKIAKKVSISKQLVKYRIERMKENGVINYFKTIIDRQKIGLSCVSMFVKLRGTPDVSEQKMISKISSHSLTGWVGKTIGGWDLLLTFLFRSVYDINNTFQRIMKLFGDKISEHIVLFDMKEYRICRKLLYENSEQRTMFFLVGENKNIPIDEKDYKLLKILSTNSRATTIECMKKLNLSDKTIKRKIEYLKKNKVIQGYTVDINYLSLGYLWFICMFQLSDFSPEKREELISFLCWHPNVAVVIDTPTDYVDVDVYVKDIQELNIFISEIKNKFKKLITKYDVITVSKVYKSDFLPKVPKPKK